MLAPRITALSIVLTIAGALGIAFIPDFNLSVIFTTIVLFIQTHLTLITFRGYKNKEGVRWRFLFNHLGLLLAIFAMFWGAPDNKEFYVTAFKEAPTREAFRNDESTFYLDYGVQLHSFNIKNISNETALYYEAIVVLGRDTALLRVNQPFTHNIIEDVYLIDYDTNNKNNVQHCTIKIVREPWKWLTATAILFMAIGAMLLFIQGAKKR